MDDNFLESCFNKRHSCLGIKLAPYSLAHVLVLDAIRSPLMNEENDARINADQFVTAVRICSIPQFPFRSKQPHKIWGKIVSHALNRNAGFFFSQIVKFREYLHDHVALPEFWEDEEKTEAKPVFGPYVLARVVHIMKMFPQISEERVWNMPIGLATWYDAQASELEGGRRIYSEEQAEEIEKTLELAESQITPEMREFAKKFAGENHV